MGRGLVTVPSCAPHPLSERPTLVFRKTYLKKMNFRNDFRKTPWFSGMAPESTCFSGVIPKKDGLLEEIRKKYGFPKVAYQTMPWLDGSGGGMGRGGVGRDNQAASSLLA